MLITQPILQCNHVSICPRVGAVASMDAHLHYIEARRRGPRETASQHFVGAPNQINTQVHLPMHVQYKFVWNHAYYYLR